ncbi:MAG: SLC13 family permease [Verrucomicrobiota bacterium]
MTFEIIIVLILLAIVLVAFFKEWAPPEIIAMSAFGFLLVFSAINPTLKLLNPEDAFSVFSSKAPITIAAMFILSGALQQTGAINGITRLLTKHLSSNQIFLLLCVTVFVALASAFVNNTPIVAIFIPVLLSLARTQQVAPSKLLIPLSYAAIMGGACTLIGTSTNLIVSDIFTSPAYNFGKIGFFEITKIGLPLLLIGMAYVIIFGPKLLPSRQNVTSVLSPEERKTFLCHALIQPNSPLIGIRLTETKLAQNATLFRIIEIRRHGTRLTLPLNEVIIRPYDRILFSASEKYIVSSEDPEKKDRELSSELSEELGVQTLSVIEGSIIEGIIAPHSSLMGKSIREIRFRQTYGMLILAIHRQGKNLSKNFLDERLQFGDTILMLGPTTTFAQLRNMGDLMLLEDQIPEVANKDKAWIVWATMAAVVIVAAIDNGISIHVSAILGCLVVLWTKCLQPDDAYKSIDWGVLFLIYGMLGIGLAMEKSGAANLVAGSFVDIIKTLADNQFLPYVALGCFYLITNLLTEVISNSAAAIIMAPIAINSSLALGLDPRTFVIAVMIAASASFLTPIGYQTNTMIYGAGGYRFTDFTKFGLPLSILFWVTATLLIPIIWPFQNS